MKVCRVDGCVSVLCAAICCCAVVAAAAENENGDGISAKQKKRQEAKELESVTATVVSSIA